MKVTESCEFTSCLKTQDFVRPSNLEKCPMSLGCLRTLLWTQNTCVSHKVPKLANTSSCVLRMFCSFGRSSEVPGKWCFSTVAPSPLPLLIVTSPESSLLEMDNWPLFEFPRRMRLQEPTVVTGSMLLTSSPCVRLPSSTL